MTVSDKDLAALGLKEIDDYVAVPDAWTQRGYRTIDGKNGKKWRVFCFDRPNEPMIELFEHSLELRAGKFYVKPSHAERQSAAALDREQARKTQS